MSLQPIIERLKNLNNIRAEDKMSKNYIEKAIEEKVLFKPDYSQIKEKVDIEPKRKNRKRWVWPSLSIGFVSITIIVVSILIIYLRSNPITPLPTVHEGVHYTNIQNIMGSGGGNQDIQPPFPLIWCSIDIEKDHYNYNEVFTMKYTIHGYTIDGITSDHVADDKVLDFKIVSDKFEFLSPTEYHFDLQTDVSIYENVLSFGNEQKDTIFPIEMELKLKAIQKCDLVESIQILLKFPLKENFKENLINFYDSGEIYKWMQYELTKDFSWIERVYFINDDLGTLLVDLSKKFAYPNSNIYSSSPIIVDAETEIMYRSLNRLYSNDLISKNDYMKRLICYFTSKRTYLGWIGTYIQDKHIVLYEYYSKNFRAKFKLNDEYDYLLELYQKDQESRIQVTKELLKILYEENKITLEEYQNEITMIDEEGLLLSGSWKGFFYEYNVVLVPFKDYAEYYFDIYVEK